MRFMPSRGPQAHRTRTRQPAAKASPRVSTDMRTDSEPCGVKSIRPPTESSDLLGCRQQRGVPCSAMVEIRSKAPAALNNRAATTENKTGEIPAAPVKRNATVTTGEAIAAQVPSERTTTATVAKSAIGAAAAVSTMAACSHHDFCPLDVSLRVIPRAYSLMRTP